MTYSIVKRCMGAPDPVTSLGMRCKTSSDASTAGGRSLCKTVGVGLTEEEVGASKRFNACFLLHCREVVLSDVLRTLFVPFGIFLFRPACVYLLRIPSPSVMGFFASFLGVLFHFSSSP
eukprot:RCo025138